jgi:hypothetical protein
MYYKWVGTFISTAEGCEKVMVVTLKMHVTAKRYAMLAVKEKINTLLLQGFALCDECLIRCNKDYQGV